jgi:hypothetical protein
MLKIEIKKGEEKIDIPTGIFVNGYIINVPSFNNPQPVIQLNNGVNTHVHTDYTQKEK